MINKGGYMKKKILCLVCLFLTFFCFAEKSALEKRLQEDNWCFSFYNDVLETEQRETYYKYASYYLENPETWIDSMDAYYPWYERDWWPAEICFSKDGTGIYIASHTYDVKSIKENKIEIVVDERWIEDNNSADQYINANWKLLHKKKFTFIFEFDGDYLDLYVNDKKHLFATFCRYGIRTYNQLIKLINTNECQSWKIKFPERADGSIDYVSEKK